MHLRPGEGVSLAACEADGSLHAHVLIPSASARRRFELGPRALDLLRGAGEAAPVSLPAGCYAWAHAPGERGVRVGLGERFEAREFPGRPRGHWAALVGLAGPDLVGRYGGDLPALLRDYGGVAGGVLEVDEHGALDKWICFNGRLRDPCDGVALASRVPLPLASLYLHFEDAGELKRALDGDPALRAALGGAGDGPVFLKATRPGDGPLRRDDRAALRRVGLLRERDGRAAARRRAFEAARRDASHALAALPRPVFDLVLGYVA